MYWLRIMTHWPSYQQFAQWQKREYQSPNGVYINGYGRNPENLNIYDCAVLLIMGLPKHNCT